MANLALYRKYRSLTFDEVVGQEHIVNALKTQVMSGRVSHAYLFTGTRGTGKTSCAKILARAVNCLNPENGNPCNKCEACLSALNDTAMDISEIDAASNNGVENIRQLRDECQYSPAALKKRVYIIDEVHMLSTGAFNAMLKTLEEPPEHTIFILATTEIHKVPITILSRCQRYDFRRIAFETICDHLKKIAYKEGFSVSDDAVALIAKMGDGSMRDSISLLDRCLSETDNITYESAIDALSVPQNDRIAKIWDCICRGDVPLCLEQFGEAYSEGRDIVSLFDNLLSLIRDIYIIKSVKNPENIPFSTSFTLKELKEMSGEVSPPLLDYFIETINDLLSRFTRTAIRRMDGEVCLIKLCSRPSSPKAEIAVEANDFTPVSKTQPVKVPDDDDAPPFDIPPAQKSEPSPAKTFKMQKPVLPFENKEKTEETLKQNGENSLKNDFIKALGTSVNVATRQFINSSSVVSHGNSVYIVCDSSYYELLQRTSVKNAANEAAKKIGFDSAFITDKAPKNASDKPAKKEEDSSGLDELIKKAKEFGFTK